MSQLMGAPVSDEAVRLSTQYQLGQPRGEYKGVVATKGCGSVFAFGVGLLLILAGFNGSSVGMIVAGVVGLLLGFGLLMAASTNSGRRAFMFSDGFVNVNGNDVSIVRWENVIEIYQRIIEHRGRTGSYKTYTYKIKQKNGTEFTFDDNFQNIERLCDTVEREVGKRLLPKVISAYETGERVVFGQLSVSKSGISNGREELPWNEVSDITIRNGSISVKKLGKWLNWSSFSTPTTPNITVLQLLIHFITGEQGR